MRQASVSLLVVLLAFGCQKAEQKTESKREGGDASGASKVEAIDPDLAQAVAAASVAGPRGSGAAPMQQVEGGPPPDGVFAPGAADKELPRGGMPKVTLGGEGAEPRVKLGPGKAPAKLSGTIQLAIQTDPRQGAIPVLLGVSIEPKKLDGAGDGMVVSQPVLARITSAKIDAPSVPKDIDDKLGKLKGSKVEYSLLPGGAGAGFRYDATKAAPEEFRDVVRSLSEALSLLTIPYPDKPLGAGGYFMVTSRDDVSGLDLLTYRLIKVKQVTEQGATLEVNTKRYAASRTFDLQGLPEGIDKTVSQFQSTSEGTVELAVGALLPGKGEINSVLAAELGPAALPGTPPGKQPHAVLQFQTRTQLDLK
ncbi:MAG TPA: hypothetical protein VIW29_16780 [Polyangiaceae bacterium]